MFRSNDEISKKRKVDLEPFKQTLRIIGDNSANSDLKNQKLQEIESCSPSIMVELFDDSIATFQKCFTDNSPKTVKSSAITAILHFVKSTCKTPYHLGNAVESILPKVSHYFNSLSSELNTFGGISVDPEAAMSIIKYQTECLHFVARTSEIALEIPNHSISSFYTIFDEGFNMIHSACFVPSHPVIVQLQNQIGNEVATFFSDTKQLLTYILNIAAKFCEDGIPEDSPEKKKKWTDADTLALVCMKLAKVGEVNDLGIKNTVWRKFKEILSAFPIVKGKIIAGPISDSLCSQLEGAYDDWLKAALIPVTDEVLMEKKRKYVRFFFPLMNVLWDTQGSFIPQYQGLVSFLLRMFNQFPPSWSTSNLNPESLQFLETAVVMQLRKFLRVIWNAIPTDESKINFVKCVCEDNNQTNLHLGRILVLIEIYQMMAFHDPMHPNPSKLVFETVKSLDVLVESFQQAYVHFFTKEVMSPLYYRALSSVFNAILKTFSYQDIETFSYLEDFMLRTLLHPHFLCGLLALDMWSFYLTTADQSLMQRHVNMICELLLSSSNSVASDRLISILKRSLLSLPEFLKESIYSKLMHPIQDGKFSQTTIIAVQNLPLDYFSETLKRSLLSSYVPLCLEMCSKWLNSMEPPSKLYQPLVFLSSVFAQNLRISSNLSQIQRQRMVEIVVQIASKPQLPSDPKVLVVLLELAIRIAQSMNGSKLFSLLSAFSTFPSSCPQSKIRLAQFLTASSMVKVEPTFQTELFNKYAVLWHALLLDSDWTVFSEAMKQFKVFAAFSPFENFDSFVPSEAGDVLVSYLEHGLFPLHRTVDEYQSLLQESRDVIASTKKRKFTPQVQIPIPIAPSTQYVSPSNSIPNGNVSAPSNVQSNSGTNGVMTKYPNPSEDNVRKAVRSIKEGLQLLDPLPEMNRGALEFLKQEVKSVKTILRKIEEQLYPNEK